MGIKERLALLREMMAAKKINSYIITKKDPHQSEYVPDYWNGVRFISGFTGSEGTVVVTMERAVLWTDGRYFIQAEIELKDSGIELFKIGTANIKDVWTFVKDETPVGGVIAFDGRTVPMSAVKSFHTKIFNKRIEMCTSIDLIGDIWNDRPSLSNNKIYNHDIRFCGKTRNEKIAQLRKKMLEEGADIYILSSLDDIAWIFNLRGNDLKNLTFFTAYAVITMTEAILFSDKNKLTDVSNLLAQDGVIMKEYSEVNCYISSCDKNASVMINPNKTSVSLYNLLKNFNICMRYPDITSELKAIKNEVEIANIENSAIRDGVIMVRFIKWLKDSVAQGEKLTECDISDKLLEFREGAENYLFPSFDTIAAYMGNAAMAHYRAIAGNCAQLKPEGFLLVDCGGNYLDGTTDITRTIMLGDISEEMRSDFTLVLKAHIALATTVFIYGASGSHLDIRARYPMWKQGIDYKHGTGHGIGFCLSVHEGPQSIGMAGNTTKLESGMIISNEPGIYRQGKHGIRTENTILVCPHSETEFGKFLYLKTISYCPIELGAIDVEIMTTEEKEWLNNYHKLVYKKLSPFLNIEEAEWLKEATKQI